MTVFITDVLFILHLALDVLAAKGNLADPISSNNHARPIPKGQEGPPSCGKDIFSAWRAKR
jgi:hypothetical protein